MSSIDMESLSEGVKTILGKKEEPNNKVGRVRKCPQCGAAVPASKVVCPECGWEFDDTNDKENAVALLQKKLRSANTLEKDDVIATFPISKSKNNLMELTIFFRAKLKAEDEYEDAYMAKYEECILMIKQYYETDPDFAKLLADYETYKKESVKKSRRNKISAICWIAGIIAVIVLIVWLVGIDNLKAFYEWLVAHAE